MAQCYWSAVDDAAMAMADEWARHYHGKEKVWVLPHESKSSNTSP